MSPSVPEVAPGPAGTGRVIRRLLGMFRSQGRLFALLASAMVVAALLQLPAPVLTMQVVDRVSATGGDPRTFVNFAAVALVAVLLLMRGVNFLQRFWLEKFRYRITFALQRSLFSHVLKLPLSYHLRHSSGYLMARVNEDPYRIQGVMADSLLSLLRDLLTLLVGVAFLFWVHWGLALIAILALPPLLYLFLRVRTDLKDDFREVQEKSAHVSQTLGESFSAVRTIKALAVEPSSRRRFVTQVTGLIRQRFRILRKRLIYENLIGLLTGLVPVIILWLGALEIIAGRLTLGEYVAFNGFLGYLYRPAEGIVISLLSMQGSIAAAERVFEVMDTAVEAGAEAFPTTVVYRPPSPAAVDFQGVGFRYDENGDWVFRNLHLSLPRGSITVIEGPSGAGKSTLLQVIPRLVSPQEGVVRIHGMDHRTLPLRRLRRQALMVSLETELFAASIAENLTLGLQGISRAQLDEALRIACADGFVTALPNRLNTRLGQTGLNLSAGQRQRLLIARAVLRHPSILILDEATAYLDPELEQRVLHNLRSLTEYCSVLCVSHRPAVAGVADRLLRLEAGDLHDVNRIRARTA